MSKLEKWARAKYNPCIPMGKDGRKVTACEEHIALSRKAAVEGTVLLKNDNHMLPLKVGQKIAVFGKAQYDYVKGGGGSGDVNTEYAYAVETVVISTLLSIVTIPLIVQLAGFVW